MDVSNSSVQPTVRRGPLAFFSDFHNRTILFRVGDWIFVTYGFLASFAFVAGFTVTSWYDAMTGQNAVAKAQFYVFFLLPSILLGCRLFSILLEWRDLFRKPIQTLVKPGYMLHGGIFGAIAAMWAYGVYTGTSVLLILDSAVMGTALGEAICRLGCYVYGCCWGRPTEGRFGVRYTSPHSKVVRCAPHLRGVKIHPAQVYGLVGHLALFVLLYALLPYKRFDGLLAATYLIAHPLIRFTLEYFRQDDRGRLWGPFTHTNLYSVFMIGGGALVAYLGMQGGNTAVDTSIRWVHVIGQVDVVGWYAIAALVCFAAYGVHYKNVGSWVTNPSAGLTPNLSEMGMGATERLDQAMGRADQDHTDGSASEA